MKQTFENYKKEVSLKFNVYNGIFQTLGLSTIYKTGIVLPVFADFCKEKLHEGYDPVKIIDTFFEEQKEESSTREKMEVLFRFIKFIERQVVLVDALEDASFGKINDLEGTGSFKSFKSTAENRNSMKELNEALNKLKVRVVLTAHPTQFYPGQVLGIIKDLGQSIRENDIPSIKQLLAQLGYTPFFNKEKPTPYDEAVNLIWFLENLFYHSIPDIYQNLAEQMDLELDDVAEKLDNFQLGFWPGGDRDGNPFVNSEITLKVADRLRSSVMKCYYRDIRLLKRKLTFRQLEPLILDIEQRCYEGGFLGKADQSFSVEYLLGKIEEMRSILINDYKSLYLQEIDLFKMKVRAFGFHFASLDIRQDNDVIKQSFDLLREKNPQAFKDFDSRDLPSYFSWDAKAELPEIEDPVLKDTLETFKTARTITERNGRHGSYRYIISNCNSARSVARVYLMAKMLAWEEDLPIDVVPLFETIQDLEKAADTMETLYSNPNYRKHLDERSGKQVIMLGFSDGTKDGGYITANWSIYKAKEEITNISRKYGVKALFFDGRGGPPARGGGNTHKFYASLGGNIESEEIQLTIQGQTISSNFGTRESSRFNLEQLFTAGLENLVFDDEQKNFSPGQRSLIEDLSALSGKVYQEFKKHPQFIPYLEKRSTLRYYNRANIGSRPSKRGKTTELTLKDLRAIPFVGAWSQLKQNVPGFYGLGTALEEMDKAGRLEEVSNLYHDNLFFKTLIENSMQSLCKTYFPLTQYMRDDPEFGDFWFIIHKEYERAVKYLLRITDQKELLDNNPGIRESIKLREGIVLPLLVIQQYGLMKVKQIEQGLLDESPDLYEKLVVRSLYGNINASRNSA